MLHEVAKQLHSLQSDAPEGIKVFMNEGDLTDIQANIEGPGTLYVLFIRCLLFLMNECKFIKII